MKKIILLLFITFFCTGCGERAAILFNAEPITEQNVMHTCNTFAEGQKIYYLFYSPKEIKFKFIRVQVFKVADNINRSGYSIYLTNDYRIMKQNVFYYTNDFTIYQKGRYVMQVFRVDNLCKPLAYNEFWIR